VDGGEEVVHDSKMAFKSTDPREVWWDFHITPPEGATTNAMPSIRASSRDAPASQVESLQKPPTSGAKVVHNSPVGLTDREHPRLRVAHNEANHPVGRTGRFVGLTGATREYPVGKTD
jgi:hypothetical protein